jgi:5'-3' exonuclease
MLTVNLAYDEVQNILYALREQINNSGNQKHIEEFKKASDKIKKAIDKRGGILQVEEDEENEKARIKNLVKVYKERVA